MPYHIADACREFASWSRSYDRTLLQKLFFRPTHRMLLKELTELDRRILDIGCGTGQFAAAVLARWPRTQVWGLDLSGPMLDQGRHRVADSDGHYQVVQADSERLPFANDSFDVVTCTHSFHHYPHQDLVAAEMHRVLRPGGRIMIADGDRDGAWGWFLFDVLVVMVEGPVKHLTTADFRELYHQIGFANVVHRRRGGLLPFHITIGQAVKQAGRMRRSA